MVLQMSIERTGWGKPTCMKYNGRHSYRRFSSNRWGSIDSAIMRHTKCPKCGWVVDLDEPHTKTHPMHGRCYFYHEWCFPKVNPIRKEMTDKDWDGFDSRCF